MPSYYFLLGAFMILLSVALIVRLPKDNHPKLAMMSFVAVILLMGGMAMAGIAAR